MRGSLILLVTVYPWKLYWDTFDPYGSIFLASPSIGGRIDPGAGRLSGRRKFPPSAQATPIAMLTSARRIMEVGAILMQDMMSPARDTQSRGDGVAVII